MRFIDVLCLGPCQFDEATHLEKHLCSLAMANISLLRLVNFNAHAD
ncbi:hypothetical protein NC653_012198 [Populus alba x Populus x berolinensis]|uniref:Uncharacterized protein n=1 Tax=Populus alba x Populus x berolinensis TaxID=444605 RepID=A0AAD6R5A4_9ROSI|nr:hypothetical protein NC653_012198 [Populus alba x Populus x berolinensis]